MDKNYTSHITSLFTRLNNENARETLAQAESILKETRLNADLGQLIAACHYLLGHVHKAIEILLRVQEVEPEPSVFVTLTDLYKIRGQETEALATVSEGASIFPEDETLALQRIRTLIRNNLASDAADALRAASNSFHWNSTFQHAEADVLVLQGSYIEAIEKYKSLYNANYETARSAFAIGACYKRLCDYSAALDYFFAARSANASWADVHREIGDCCYLLDDHAGAKDAYLEALRIAPRNPELVYTYAQFLHGTQEYATAERYYSEYCKSIPGATNALENLARVQLAQQKYEVAANGLIDLLTDNQAAWYSKNLAAIAAIAKEYRNISVQVCALLHAVASSPSDNFAVNSLHFAYRTVCNWRWGDLALCLFGLRDGQPHMPVDPFGALCLEDCPNNQLKRSSAMALCGKRSNNSLPGKASNKKKCRIGYFSSDFKSHAGMFNMVALFERHDTHRFEVFGFALNELEESDIISRIKNSPLEIVQCAGRSNAEVRELVRSYNLDIVINRDGFTKNNRFSLFFDRLAPLHINYLGYPGSLADENTDYIVCDQVVIPPDYREHYSEDPLYLPYTYFPADDNAAVSEKNTYKTDWGLPKESLVLAVFHNSYKIDRSAFSTWLQLLKTNAAAVLWVYTPNTGVLSRLQSFASEVGISADRIIAARPVEHDVHLERHKHVDLMLDTFAYNGHTTTLEALYMGVPVVTLQGHQMAARVSSSLLHAAGLQELVCHTKAEYRTLIQRLVSDKDLRRQMQQKAETLRTTPLFQSEAYTRALEDGLIKALEAKQAGDSGPIYAEASFYTDNQMGSRNEGKAAPVVGELTREDPVLEVAYRFADSEPAGSALWLIAKERIYGGIQLNIPRQRQSKHDPRQPEKFSAGFFVEGDNTIPLHIGGDRMAMEHHGYAPVYEAVLSPFVNDAEQPVTLIEIGILRGHGLAIWCDLFPNARVIGLDLDPDIFAAHRPVLEQRQAFQQNTPEVYAFDQFDPDTNLLQSLLNEGAANIIIDAGAHTKSAVIRTLEAILPMLSSKQCVYVVEDMVDVEGELRTLLPKWQVFSVGHLSIATNVDFRKDLKGLEKENWIQRVFGLDKDAFLNDVRAMIVNYSASSSDKDAAQDDKSESIGKKRDFH